MVHAPLEIALDRRRDGLSRLAALRVLGDGGPSDARAISALLSSRDPGLVAASASAIASIASRAPSEGLRRELAEPLLESSVFQGPWVRARIENALVALGAFDESLAVLTGRGDGARDLCARVVGRLATGERLRLILSWADPDPNVRLAIALSLGDKELDEPSLRTLQDALSHEPDERVRAVLAAATRDLQALRSVFGSGDEGVRAIAARALGRQGDPSGLSDPVVLVRRAAAEGLCAAAPTDASLAALLLALSDEDARVRAGAAAALGQSRSEECLRPLLAALADKDSRVRKRAAASLAARGEDARSVLIEAFEAADRNVRECAAMAAGLGRRNSSLEEELLRLLSDGAVSVRHAAADSLGRLGSRRLFDAMASATDAVRAAAARGLAAIPDSTPALVAALSDADISVRRAAAQALVTRHDPRALDPLIDAVEADSSLLLPTSLFGLEVSLAEAERAARRAPRHAAHLLVPHGGRGLEVLEELASSAPSVETVNALAEATLRLYGADRAPVLAALSKAAESPDPLIRVAVVDARARLGESVRGFLFDASREVVARACSSLLASGALEGEAELIERVGRPGAPGAAFAALGTTGTPRALETLIEGARRGGKAGNLAALGIYAFGDAAAKTVVRELKALQRAELIEGQEALVRALAELEGDDVLATLLDAATSTSAEVRAVALRGLKKRRDPRTLETLISALDSPHSAVAAAAADALGTEASSGAERGEPALDSRVIRGLADLLLGGEVDARQEAARTMANLADWRAVPALAAALLDVDPEVRRDAAEALQLLGIPVGIEVEAPIGK